MPIVVSEQIPFKPTVDELNLSKIQHFLYKKKTFSMVTDELKAKLRSPEFAKVKNIYLCGIEGHVCILQTAIDLRRLDYNVFLIKDGISSQRTNDLTSAFERMNQIGCITTTSESLIFEIMKNAKHPKFRAVIKLIKEKKKKKKKKSCTPTKKCFQILSCMYFCNVSFIVSTSWII